MRGPDDGHSSGAASSPATLALLGCDHARPEQPPHLRLGVEVARLDAQQRSQRHGLRRLGAGGRRRRVPHRAQHLVHLVHASLNLVSKLGKGKHAILNLLECTEVEVYAWHGL